MSFNILLNKCNGNLFTDESRYMRRSELDQKCLTWFKKIDCNDTLKGV